LDRPGGQRGSGPVFGKTDDGRKKKEETTPAPAIAASVADKVDEMPATLDLPGKVHWIFGNRSVGDPTGFLPPPDPVKSAQLGRCRRRRADALLEQDRRVLIYRLDQ